MMNIDSDHDDLPLAGLVVLDFSQFLAGPSASLRLADLGARVIKIERPGSGDLCRQLYVSDLQVDGDSTLFHTINRNKASFAADLKNPEDLERVRGLIASADVMIQNFRPGIIERLGLGYEDIRKINPRIVYASVSGYGDTGPWRDKPGQDLLVQAMSGLAWLNGDADAPPVAAGVAVADMITGTHLAQGILAALIRRGGRGTGSRVDVSLLESIMDLQFEFFTTFLNGSGEAPVRGRVCSASAYLSAPYGIYPTRDGFLALAMNPIGELARLLEIPALEPYSSPDSWFESRDEIKAILRDTLSTRTTRVWLDILTPADIWCAEVMDWPTLVAHEGFKALDMIQDVATASGARVTTTRCPIRIDGRVLKSAKGAPKVGEDTDRILQELLTEHPHS
ncbi:MAG: CaiB/BaiF CoA transferase family protein [Castellaniella sp.]|uniref:CaiB/BaiF CoA transferase family protein n=1 Tax=Castellaniella sp. TaxID=1955812 RepID=UPI003A83737B